MRASAVIEAQRGTLLLWAPVALAAGIGAYFALPAEPPASAGVAAMVGGMALLAALGRAGRAGIAMLAAVAVLGFGLAKLQTDRVAAPVLDRVVFGAVAGRVTGLDRSAENRLRVLLDEVWIEGIEPDATPRRVRIVLPRSPGPDIVAPGNRVMLRARLTPPPPPVAPGAFDFRRHAWFLGIGAIGSATGPVLLAETPQDASPAGLRLLSLRMALSDAVRAELEPRSGGFAAAILFGDRSGIDPGDLVDLRVSNLAHLLAISGLHMALLTGAVFAALRLGLAAVPALVLRLPAKKLAAVGALMAGAGYLAISGASVATQRAFVMVAVALIAVMVDRPALSMRGVAISALIVLALDPFALMGAGFQMSYAATIGLIAVYGALRDSTWWQGIGGARAGRVAGFVVGLALTSLVAGLATAPFSAFHFNQMSRYGLLANILAVPAMGLVVMPAALVAGLLWPLGLAAPALAVMEAGIRHILGVAAWAADLPAPLTLVPSGPGWVPAAVGLGGYALAVLRSPVRLCGVAIVLLAFLGWAAAPRPDVLVDPEGALVAVRGEEGLALNRGRGGGFAARSWLRADADPAAQKEAAMRGGAPEKEEVMRRLPDGTEILWLAKARDASSYCRPGRLIIAPEARDRVPRGCLLIGAELLEREGALAFRAGALDAPISVAARAGRRPWTGAQ